MRILLKIFVVPVVLFIIILKAVMRFIYWLSSVVLLIPTFILGVGGAGILLTGKISIGISALVMAFLLSPYGIPAIAEWIAGLLDDANYSLKCFIRG